MVLVGANIVRPLVGFTAFVGGVLLRPLPEHLMKPKTGGAEPLPYEGNANHRKEIPKFLFCNSSEERANDVRPYNPHPQQSNKPKFN